MSQTIFNEVIAEMNEKFAELLAEEEDIINTGVYSSGLGMIGDGTNKAFWSCDVDEMIWDKVNSKVFMDYTQMVRGLWGETVDDDIRKKWCAMRFKIRKEWKENILRQL